jgi:hypothetical protein
MRRLLWFAAWDHYNGGDTEVSVFLPCGLDIDIPWGFQTIYLEMLEWDAVLDELSAVGKVCLGDTCVPKKFYEFWKKEGDFLEAGTFEGDLRDLIVVFARHERVEDLLPFLKRENEPESMFVAAVFAAIDATKTAPDEDDRSALAEAIINIGGLRYAAPSTSKSFIRFTGELADLISRLPADTRRDISGPLWVSPARYAELEPNRLDGHEAMKLMVLNDGRVVVRV